MLWVRILRLHLVPVAIQRRVCVAEVHVGTLVTDFLSHVSEAVEVPPGIQIRICNRLRQFVRACVHLRIRFRRIRAWLIYLASVHIRVRLHAEQHVPDISEIHVPVKRTEVKSRQVVR
jgi:hypothetical protein